MARRAVALYNGLDAEGRRALLRPARARLLARSATRCWPPPRPTAATPRRRPSRALQSVTEPPRQEVFRRMNMAPGGTAGRWWGCASALLDALPAHPHLASVDDDLTHLFGSWFNRGFLELRRIDWGTPASILEKLIAYEAVHEIHGFPDLKRRLERDRRCFAFFHPALPDEPLVFVEVAFVDELPAAVAPILVPGERRRRPAEGALRRLLLDHQLPAGPEGHLVRQLPHQAGGAGPARGTAEPAPFRDPFAHPRVPLVAAAPGRRPGLAAAAPIRAPGPGRPGPRPGRGAARAPRGARRPLPRAPVGGRATSLDPVARFHLGNGARLERINWLADTSPKGLRQSLGMMVNYVYALEDVERNHESYVNRHVVACSAGRGAPGRGWPKGRGAGWSAPETARR